MPSVKKALLGFLLVVSVLGHSHSHSHGSHSHGHSHGGEAAGAEKCKSMLAAPEWLQEYYETDKTAVSVSASLLTSCVPVLIILFCPAAPSKGVLHALLAFAAGSLLGDAMLHLLPHAMMETPPPPSNPVTQFLSDAHVSMPHLLFLVGLGIVCLYYYYFSTV